MIATNSDNQNMLNNLIFQAKLRNNQTQFEKNIVKNILAVKLIDSMNQTSAFMNNNYELCMKLDTSKLLKDP